MDKELACELARHSLVQQDASLPLHHRLYLALRQAILDGRLGGGDPLPSTRQLCVALALGRNTVVRAYEQLRVEGYLEGRQGSGSYVSETLGRRAPVAARKPLPGNRREGLSQRGRQIASHPASSSIQRGAFIPGVPDTDQFPFAIWRRLIGRHITRETGHLLDYAGSGYGPLKMAIAEYLGASRLMRCDPRQIVILNGSHQAMDLCARMLCDTGDRAWIEDPGYWGARNVLRAAGLTTLPIPLDEGGIAPCADDWLTPPRLIYVSPSSQYPTGTVLSLERRLALLEGADSAGAWIIEDDYDNELRHDERAVASLFGLARRQRVIYLGTFSKAMFPGLRLSYMVLPEDLVDAFQIGNAELYRGGRLIEQAALAEFIAEGHYSAHIRRMRQVYRERREVLAGEMERWFGGAVGLSGGHAGLQLLYHFNGAVDDTLLATGALARGLVVRPLSMYYQEQAARRHGMNLGYGGVPVERIRAAVPLLAQVFDELQRAGRSRA